MALTPLNSNNQLTADARSLNALKLQAGNKDPAAIQEAAKQFESLFMREMLKSMRDATMKSGMLDSAQENLGHDMLDQQFSVQMSGKPGGLSDLIAKQLSRQMGVADTPAFDTPSTLSLGNRLPASPKLPALPPTSDASSAKPLKTTASQAGFVQRLEQAAAKVEQQSGIPASYMLGQAGHETGWGKHEIKNANGTPSFNLFGIKAGPGWTGKVAEVTTTEYVNGEPKKTVAKFRAYDSYEQSFQDYAKLINQNPRYANARQQTGSVVAFANELQRAGYATDPAYASKLSRAISTTQQLQRNQPWRGVA
ncbi:flagellar assembly peptidoglycan hydrolase FlgJ [Curvibacter sp. RS43]|uniref:Peptidoglycan hydrolase FlgJ n=1 Tax=Curvibacter microcysteis TaxID=3026419 RepID=A0ABT5MIY8_9BURK|nr:MULTISPECIES: flagellar assembly peptidoglycan hydrolase FlgJ [unclassified Curvibacter]MDD0811782.1 flagellar assembly peptidoglycan hydrolase FlgJ [Curvibacter sp. RS43]MDD0816548.1 flagellar assembly peptidoglycan hydrolase FlgJ [Curvibacter sp. HBC28]